MHSFWAFGLVYNNNMSAVEDIINYKRSPDEDFYAILNCDESSSVSTSFCLFFLQTVVTQWWFKSNICFLIQNFFASLVTTNVTIEKKNFFFIGRYSEPIFVTSNQGKPLLVTCDHWSYCKFHCSFEWVNTKQKTLKVKIGSLIGANCIHASGSDCLVWVDLNRRREFFSSG